MKMSMSLLILPLLLLAFTGCGPGYDCPSVDEDSLELNPILGGEYGQRHTNANHQAHDLEAILGYEVREDVYIRVVSEDQVEKVYVRDGQTVVEVYRVRSIGEAIRYY